MIIAMQKVRCPDCNAWLFTQGIKTGVVEIKCRKCSKINIIDVQDGIAKILIVEEPSENNSYIVLQ